MWKIFLPSENIFSIGNFWWKSISFFINRFRISFGINNVSSRKSRNVIRGVLYPSKKLYPSRHSSPCRRTEYSELIMCDLPPRGDPDRFCMPCSEAHDLEITIPVVDFQEIRNFRGQKFWIPGVFFRGVFFCAKQNSVFLSQLLWLKIHYMYVLIFIISKIQEISEFSKVCR